VTTLELAILVTTSLLIFGINFITIFLSKLLYYASRQRAFVFASTINPIRYTNCTPKPRAMDHSSGVGNPIVYCNINDAWVVGTR
jgi:hypothetical protein